MPTPAARLSLNTLLNFDVLDTAKTLEHQLREIESLCQEAKMARDRNRTRRKHLDKQLAVLNAQLHQEIATTQKLATKLQMATAGASWFPEHALFDVLNNQHDLINEHASAFIIHSEPYNESYVFNGSGSCTSPLAFDTTQDFKFSPIATAFPEAYCLPLPPSSDTFSVELSAYSVPITHFSPSCIEIHCDADARRPLGVIKEENLAQDDCVAMTDHSPSRNRTTKVRDIGWKGLWA